MAFDAAAIKRVRTQQERATETQAPAYVWVFLACLVFSLFSGHSDQLGLPMGLDRPLLLLTIVLLVLDPGTETLRWRAVYPLMGLTVVWTLISWIGSGGQLTDTYKMFALTDRIIMPFSMFVFGALIFATEYRRLLLMKTAAIMGIYLGVTAILERIGIRQLIFPRYISDLQEFQSEWRALGPFGGGEPLGMTAALIFFMSCFLFYRTHDRWRWVALASAILCLIANAMSMTRSAWLGLLLGIAVCVLALPDLRRKAPAIIGSVVVFFGLALALLPTLREDLLRRLEAGGSLYDRVNTNDAALRIITAEPLQGIGWGNFITDNVLWVRQADTYPVTTVTIEVHNVFLSRAAETGVIGAVLWGLCILLGPVLAVSARARIVEMHGWKIIGWAALMVWLVPTMMSPNPYPTPNFLVWLICGIAGRGILVNLPNERDFENLAAFDVAETRARRLPTPAEVWSVIGKPPKAQVTPTPKETTPSSAQDTPAASAPWK